MLLALLVFTASVIGPVLFGAPWHPTRSDDIRQALNWCDPQPGETLVDLGSGDGRVLILAAEEFGLRATGLEIDPLKVTFTRWRIRRKGLENQITVLRQNLFRYDFKQADIVFVYLSHQALDRLWPVLSAQLKPTARVVSYRFCLSGVKPERVNEDKTLFLYRAGLGSNVSQYT